MPLSEGESWVWLSSHVEGCEAGDNGHPDDRKVYLHLDLRKGMIMHQIK